MNEGKIQLVGEAFPYTIKRKIFADITAEIEAGEFYPKLIFIENRIESILLDKIKGSQPAIKKIKEQLL